MPTSKPLTIAVRTLLALTAAVSIIVLAAVFGQGLRLRHDVEGLV